MIDPIFLLEAAINGILLGGILALLALGLNLIFGVIEIAWIVYVDLVMLCMYVLYFTNQVHGWPFWAAALAALVAGAGLGVAVHLLVISPILTSPPINQLLATGGLSVLHPVLRDLPLDDRSPQRPVLPAELRDRRHLPAGDAPDPVRDLDPGDARPLPVPDPHLHGHRDAGGGAGPRRDGADGRRSPAGLRRDLGGGRPHGGLAGTLLVFQYSVHPLLRRPVRPAHVHDLRAGRALGTWSGPSSPPS